MSAVFIKSKYEIKELISEDIISYCYEGKTHYLDVPILIWEYKKEFLTSGLVTKCINISEKLIGFKHKNCLNMIDYFYDGEAFYTIHEGLDYFLTLDTFIKQQEKQDLKLLWKFSTHLLNTVLQLEQKHLFAGTINFSNIIVTKNLEIKFTRIMIPIEIYKGCWRDLDVIEDGVFLPPEFIQSNRFMIRSDMYSLGVLLFIFFSQKWPYKYSLKIEQMKKNLIEGPIDFEPIHPKIPDRLGRIIHICLKPDPEKRFRSFMELIKVYKHDLSLEGNVDSETSTVIGHLKDHINRQAITSYRQLMKSVVMGVGIIGALFAVYTIYLNYITAIPEVAVPNLKGLTGQEAEEVLESYNLNSLISGKRFHPQIDADLIIETKPPAGRIVKENRIIRIFVSKGQGPTLVPDLVGYSKEHVEEKLDGKGLITQVEKEAYSLQYPEGIVIKQNPIANTFIGPSDNIKLIISKGYPVVVDVSQAKSSFFQDKSHLKKVQVEFFILDDWESQEITIFFKHNDLRNKIYSDLVKPGDNLKLEFELEEQGVIEIYFNNELTIKRVINNNSETAHAI
ncbi:MAG: hypothetical protein CMP21_01005 [Rickettsiales bacterium]|nr:hypothetical protein [Rickettsiales bacterium]|tara:strand:- start:19393 stop:21084 length:1692 start_codon:yes stop_codon:yes gene_type:complete